MSGYRVALVIVLLGYFSLLFANEATPIAESDDTLIIKGLLYTDMKSYDQAREAFATLYDRTGEKEHLFREMALSLLSRKHLVESIKRLEAYEKQYPQMLDVKRLLVALYLTHFQIEDARKTADYLTAHSSKVSDLDLAANAYLFSGDYNGTISLLQKAYAQDGDEDVLLRMATIMDEEMDQRKESIRLLETHRHIYGDKTGSDIYIKLLELYVKENDVDGVLEIYQTLYAYDRNDEYLDKIMKAYAFKGDVDGAIAFLEKNKAGQKTLYQLYKSKKYFAKAMKLAQKFYEKEHDPKWLAEIAILTYEQAKDKSDQKMIEKVVKTFDKALAQGVDDSIYLNYYGYTLIDKEIDVKKGMKILQNALDQQPDNMYYLDSLAWGYYKERMCKKAYELMQKVVAHEGLKEPEIAEHWDMIKKCNK